MGPSRRGGARTWIHRSPDRVTLEANAGGRAQARPSSYRWQAAAPSGASSILVYADDPDHPAPETYVDLALQALGLSYTAFYEDWAGFEDALTSQEWDVVLVTNDNFRPEVSTLDAMADHETVPEITQREGDLFGIYGQRVEPIDGTAVAGYTTPGPDQNEAALIVGSSERTIFKGFVDGDNNADLDGDGIRDGVELWTGMIRGLVEGFDVDVPWLSVAPASGQVAVGASTDLVVTVDATGLAPGRYEAQVVVRTNDPQGRSLRHPVTLVVPRSSIGINSGGPAYTTGAGDVFRADRAFTPVASAMSVHRIPS
ncbi:hypothetical protein BH18CHL1_BH18CHL1_05080 [soil metagenome]